MPVELWLLASIFVLTPIAVCVTLYVMVRRMGRTDLHVVPVSEADAPERYRQAQRHDAAARDAGLEFLGGFAHEAMPSIFVAAWADPEQARWFCVYVTAQREYYDWVTIFEAPEPAGLTTSSSRDAAVMPTAPRHAAQVFSGLGPEALRARHAEAESYIDRTFGLRPAPPSGSFQVEVEQAVRRQSKYVRSLLLWPLRAPWWYFVRRHRQVGLTVEQQHRAGRLAGWAPGMRVAAGGAFYRKSA